MTSAKSRKPVDRVVEEEPDWAARPVEGDPSIGDGQQVEPVVDAEPFDPKGYTMKLMEWCVSKAERTDDDDNAWMEQTVKAALQALESGGDAAAVLQDMTPVQAEDVVDKGFLLHGFTLTASEHDDGWPFYANMDVTPFGSNEHLILNCGGIKVIAKLCALDTIGEYPYAVKIKATVTRKNRTIYDLVDGRA